MNAIKSQSPDENLNEGLIRSDAMKGITNTPSITSLNETDTNSALVFVCKFGVRTTAIMRTTLHTMIAIENNIITMA
jgi:hypothetical protein